jgi:hypothetical protein
MDFSSTINGSKEGSKGVSFAEYLGSLLKLNHNHPSWKYNIKWRNPI